MSDTDNTPRQPDDKDPQKQRHEAASEGTPRQADRARQAAEPRDPEVVGTADHYTAGPTEVLAGDITAPGPEQSGELTREDLHTHLDQVLAQTEAEGPVIGVREGMWGPGHGPGDTSGFDGMHRIIQLNGNAQPPFGGWFDDVADRMAELVPHFASRVLVWRDEITFVVLREKLLPLVKVLRDDPALRFEVCMSVSGVHYPNLAGAELHAVYHLLSYTHNRRIRLEVACPDEDPHIPSICSVYPMVNYHERETYDMFGIIFDGHPGLTRILMPDDWVGFPQRKDYPLGGIPVEYKGAVVPPPDERRSYQA
ncbi:MAG: NADH-quinone oxidoreductase subunit C [Brooklawnia sp.]